MMQCVTYRDDLEAAQARIRELEEKVRDLETREAPPAAPPVPPAPHPPRRSAASRARAKRETSKAAIGVPLVVLGLVAFIAFGSPTCARGCAAIDGEGEVAMAALRACPGARDVLGEDIAWSPIGCGNCSSKSGGDPINSGCHSSTRYTVPVSGAKSRGSYVFGSSTSTSGARRQSTGVVTTSTHTIMIGGDGKCTVTAR